MANDVLTCIKTAPAADVAEVKRSKWVQLDNSQVHYCNDCGVSFNLYSYCKNDFNYCPSCGAKMALEE